MTAQTFLCNHGNSPIFPRWQAFGVVALGSLGGMAFPAISSIKSNACADSEQGTIQVCIPDVQMPPQSPLLSD